MIQLGLMFGLILGISDWWLVHLLLRAKSNVRHSGDCRTSGRHDLRHRKAVRRGHLSGNRQHAVVALGILGARHDSGVLAVVDADLGRVRNSWGGISQRP